MQEEYGQPGGDPTCEPGEGEGTTGTTGDEPTGGETDDYGYRSPPSDPPPGGGSGGGAGGSYDYGDMGDPPPSGG